MTNESSHTKPIIDRALFTREPPKAVTDNIRPSSTREVAKVDNPQQFGESMSYPDVLSAETAPVIKKAAIPVHEKILSTIIINMTEEIRQRATGKIPGDLSAEDLQCMLFFQRQFRLVNQEKMVNGRQVANEWFSLMKFIENKADVIDTKYRHHDYFGIRDLLVSIIMNIAYSYILFGGNTIGNSPVVDSKTTVLTVNDQINIFFSTLLKRFAEYEVIYEQLDKLDKYHQVYTLNRQQLMNDVTMYRRQITSQETDIKTIKDKNEIIMFKDAINKNKLSVEDKNTKIAKLTSEITKINDTIQKHRYDVAKSISHVLDIIKFDYFMSDHWCPSMDVKKIINI